MARATPCAWKIDTLSVYHPLSEPSSPGLIINTVFFLLTASYAVRLFDKIPVTRAFSFSSYKYISMNGNSRVEIVSRNTDSPEVLRFLIKPRKIIHRREFGGHTCSVVVTELNSARNSAKISWRILREGRKKFKFVRQRNQWPPRVRRTLHNRVVEIARDCPTNLCRSYLPA